MELEEELKQLKTVLRSLVVSSPARVDARSLLRDYRSMVGAQLPLAKFGYRDPIAFLRGEFSDCFLGPAANPDLTLIVPESLKHVDKLVQKQKASSTTKFKGKRRSVLECKPSQDATLTVSLKNDQSGSRRQVSCREYSNCTKRMERITINGETTKYNNHTSNTICSKQSQASSQDSEESPYDDREDRDSGRLTTSSSSIRTRTQLEELKREVRELVLEQPEGVWCTDLVRLYRERHGRELNYSRFGFTSVLSLAGAVPDVALTQRADRGDWLLSDERVPAPPAPRPAPPRTAARAPARARRAAEPEDALPGTPYAAEVFPADCMRPEDSIPAASLAGVDKGAMLEVVVGEVYSPSHFWLVRLGEHHNIAMENIMDEMNEYYKRGEGRERRLLAGAVRVGYYCSSCYDGDWHRSLIVRILDEDTVKVRHVDYGTVDACPVGGLRPLRREWAALEAQAVRGRLAGVRPPAEGRSWPRAAAHHFLNLVRDTQLVANVIALDHQVDALEVLLIDTSTEEDRCISEQLIRAGHADPRADSALGTSECYLFPRFEALESGATPNFAEIYTYLRNGVALDCVDDYRQHVPPCLPAVPPNAPVAVPLAAPLAVPLAAPVAVPLAAPLAAPLAVPPAAPPAAPLPAPLVAPPAAPLADLAAAAPAPAPKPRVSEPGPAPPHPAYGLPMPMSPAYSLADMYLGAAPVAPPPSGHARHVTLSAEEVNMYRMLMQQRLTDTARMFALETLNRHVFGTAHPPTLNPPTLNPDATEFRSTAGFHSPADFRSTAEFHTARRYFGVPPGFETG